MSNADPLRYPIGRFVAPDDITLDQLNGWMETLERLPDELRRAVQDWTDSQLDTPYRPGGWTVRQVVHHIPDSHLNCYQRCRFALTEAAPRIKDYDEAAWARLPDAKSAPIGPSLQLLAGLHSRWVFLLRSLSPEQWRRTFDHPEHGIVRLDRTAGLYAWHSRHHLAHIQRLAEREGW